MNVFGSSALMRHSIAWPREHDVVLRAAAAARRRRSCSCVLHEVDAGDHLGDRMLDLDARVHLDEVELAVLVQELERAGAAVADCACRPRRSARPSSRAARRVMPGAGASSMTFWWRRCIEQSRSPRWIDVAVAVGQHLDLDVARRSRGISPCRPGRCRTRPCASGLVIAIALSSVASVCTTRMPRPPPPPAALMITG